jgi:WD40 repeat protein
VRSPFFIAPADEQASQDTKALRDQINVALQSNENGVHRLLDILHGMRDNVTISLLGPTAEAQLRKILDLPEDNRKAILARKALNILQFEDMSEPFDDVISPLEGTFRWWAEEQVVPVANRITASAFDDVNSVAPNIGFDPSATVQPDLSRHQGYMAIRDHGPSKRVTPQPASELAHSSTSAKALDTAESVHRVGLPEWLHSGSGIYHIVGPTGSGKSTFLKYIYRDPVALECLERWASGRKLILAKFFLRKRGSKRQHSISGLCRAVLFNVLEHCPELIPQALPDLWSQIESAPWQVEVKAQLQHDEICNALDILLRARTLSKTHAVCILIDGLDEHSEENVDHLSLVSLITRWTDAAPKDVKICATSRPCSVFLSAFSEQWRLWINHYTHPDIKKLVRHYLLEAAAFSPTTSGAVLIGSRQNLVDQIVLRSRGDIRWAITASRAMKQYGQTHHVDSILSDVDANYFVRFPTAVPLDIEPSNRLGMRANQSIGWSTTLDDTPGGVLTIRQSTTNVSSLYKRREKELRKYLGVAEDLKNDLAIVEETRLLGTCEWFKARQGYRRWLDAAESPARVLWVTGKPASGKSTLAGYIINSLQDSQEACSYFFFKHSDASKSTLTPCLRSLAYQMACADSGIHDALVTMMDDDDGRLADDDDSERAVWRKLFTDCILQKPFKRHFWIIDALDECENAVNAFHSILGKWNTDLSLRVLVTSRDTKELRMAFQDLRSQYTCEVIQSNDTAVDIKLFVKHYSPRINTKNEDARNELVRTILEKSEGSFIWTKLVLNELAEANSEKEVAAILKNVPGKMEPLYARTLLLMSRAKRGKSLASAILSWVTCASRPLSTEELTAALNMYLQEDITRLDASILAVCGQLVTVDRFNKVQLVHETVREFLLNPGLKSEFAVRLEDAHSRLAKVCLRYLTGGAMKAPRSTRQRTTRRPTTDRESAILSYACLNFSHHLFHACVTPGNQDLLERFLEDSVPSWIAFVASATTNLSALMQASKEIQSYLRRCVDEKIPCHNILRLAECWDTDLERVIAKFGDAIIAYPRAIHSLVPPLCPANSLIRKMGASSRGLSIMGLTDTDWDDHLLCIDHHARTSAVACGHKFFAVGLDTGLIATYRTSTGQAYKELQHGDRVKLICFINDTGLLASCGRNSIKVWNLEKGTVVYDLKAPRMCISLVHYQTDVDNRLLAVTSRNCLIQWDLQNNAQCLPDRQLNAGEDSGEHSLRGTPCAISISTEHQMLAAAYHGRPILLWDLEADEYYGSCGTARHMPQALVLNPNKDASLLAVSDLDGQLFLFDPFEDCALQDTRANCPQLAASPDGKFLAGAAGSGSIHIYKFESLRLIYNVQSTNIHIEQLAFAHESNRVVDIRDSFCNLWSPAVLRQAETTGGGPPSPRDTGTPQARLKVSTMLVHPDEQQIYCGCNEGSVFLYDLETGRRTSTLYGHKTHVRFITQLSTRDSILSIDSSNSMLAHKIEGSPQSTRLGRRMFGARLMGDKTITQVLASAPANKFILSTRESDHMWDFDGSEQQFMSHTNDPGIRQWAQHPQSASHVLRLDSYALRVFSWHDWSELTQVTISSPAITLQLKSTTPFTVSSAPSFLVEWSALNGNNDTLGLSMLEQRCFEINKDNSSTSRAPEPPINLQNPFLQRLSARVAHVIGTLENGNLLFLDQQSWVCSVDLAASGRPSFEYWRHFFVPTDWISSTRNVVSAVVQRRVVFAKDDGIVIFRRGLEFRESVRVDDALAGALDT